jgi:hypothetical protein
MRDDQASLPAAFYPATEGKDTLSFYKSYWNLHDGRISPFKLPVPTYDIDLCWHTHQLFPRRYREWCFRNLSRAIDHDDGPIGRQGFNSALRDTSLAWMKTYQEAYSTDQVMKKYLSIWRILGGVVNPLYGIKVLYTAIKLSSTEVKGRTLPRKINLSFQILRNIMQKSRSELSAVV